jgi:hypothetical protein
MPDVRMPDGTIIKNVPAGITKAQLNAKLTKNGFSLAELTTPKQKPSAIENIPLVGGLIAPIADIPLSVVEGLSGTTKSIADVFGADNAVSDAADYVSKAAAALKSAGSREDAEIASKIQKDAEGKGVWEEVKAAARAFTYAPLENIASVAGSAIPFVGAAVATGGTGVIPAATLAGLGTASGVGTIKGAVYDAVYDEFVKGGASKQDAEAAAERAQEYGGKNMDQIALGGAIGALASATGFPPQFARTIGANAAKNVAAKVAAREAVEVGARRSVLGGTARGAAVEAVPEAVQGGQEQLAENLALQREGFDVDTWKGVAGQAASEGIASLFLGGYGGARETRQENREALTKEIAQELDALPVDADDKAISEAEARFVKRGFPLEKARQVVDTMVKQKAAIEKQAAELEQARAERLAQEDIEISEGPDLSTLPPVDTEEQAAMQRMREEEVAGRPTPAARGPAIPYDTLTFDEASQTAVPSSGESDVIDYSGRKIVMRNINGVMVPFYLSTGSGGKKGVAAGKWYPFFGIGKDGWINKTNEAEINDYYGSPELRNVAEELNSTIGDIRSDTAVPKVKATGAHIDFINQNLAPSANSEATTLANVRANIDNTLSKIRDAQAEAAPARSTAPTITPAFAEATLQNDDDVRVFADKYGIDEAEAIDRLNAAVASPTGIKYSRRGRPPSASTVEAAGQEGLFGALPTQEENRLDKFEEIQQRKLEQGALAPEQREAERQAQADEFDRLQQERAAKDEQYKAQFVKGVEEKLQSANPANTAYSVQLDTASPKPYRIVGPDGELFAASDNLQDFEAQAARLDPYTAPPTPIQDTDSANPTVATSMVQELTREVDAARERGEIDNNQRTELIRRLERPDAYDKYGRPQDNIAKAEEEARAAMSKFRNATGVEAKAAEAELAVANEKLTKLVNNRMLNPIRATLRSMVENRQLEREGATSRVGSARVQQKLGEMEGADTSAEQREQREAKIDLAESRVSKYRRGEAQPGQVKADVSKVRAAVDAIVSVWKGPPVVEVVQSVNDIADAKVRRAVMQDNATYAEGFVVPDGTVYLIANNLESVERAKAVLFHEALGHIGLERLFRGELDSVLAALYKSNGNIRNKTDAWLVANPKAYPKDKNQIARAVEEVLAEMSENGQLRPTMIKRIAAIIRNYARKLGFNLAISDADVEAILAAGHERVVNGPQESTLVKGMRYISGWDTTTPRATKYSRPKTTKKDKEALEETSASMSDGLRRAKKSTSTNGIADGVGKAVKGRSFSAFLNAFKDNSDGMGPPTLKAILKTIPTSGILNWFGPDLPTIREIDTLVQKMTAMKANIIKASEDIGRELDEFLMADKDKVLATTMSTARINEYSPDEFKSADEALANHPAMKEIEARILKNSNDKALAARIIAEMKALTMQGKEVVGVKGDKVKRSDDMRKLLADLSKTAIDRQKTSAQTDQIAELTRRIRDVHKLWDELAEIKNGHKLYKEIRAYYKDMFEAELALLDGRISTIAGEAEAKRLRDLRADMMREVMNPDEAKKSGDIFYDLNSDLFTKDYFPFMREGQYYVRVAAAKDGTREREFYQFYSAKDMQTAQKAIAKRLGVNPEDSSVITIGNNIAQLQENIKSDDQMMKKIFDLVSKAKAEFAGTKGINAESFKDLTDSIYQTWLLSTPERSVRRRFMHAKEVVGFQQDLLQQFASQASNYANQLSKLAYAGDIRLKIGEARDNVSDRDATLRAKYNSVIDELESRAEDEINPSPQSSFINVLNRASYFYYLTAPATAMLQLTSIPIRVVPRLWRDYGYAEGTRMWLKYMRVWDTLGKAKVQTTRTGLAGAGDQLDVLMPNMLSSKLVSSDTPRGKLLRKAMAAGMERNVLETVQDTLIQNERETAKRHRTGVARTAVEARALTGKAMGVMFQGLENISRQAAYFMAFELAYDAEKAKNPSPEAEDQVFDKAVTTALNTVRDTLGDYSNWERSNIMKKDITRALFLFKMHPILQTKFLVGAMRDIGRGLYPGASPEAKAARAGAMKELGGVLMMAGVFGGLLGMPLYSVMALALSESFDEEDDEDVRRLMELDPRVAYDSDIMFRAWIMDKFGEPMIGNVSMADILIHGPLGALSNTELSSRTSLDLKTMWFREAVTGDSTGDTLIKTALANIAGGQMLIQMFNAKDNFAEGDMYGAIKKVAPAFIRSWVAAEQGEAEGIVTRKGDSIIAKDDISALDTLRTISGFRPMRLARWQDYYITRGKNDKKIKAEKTQLLSTLDRKIREGEIASMAELKEFVADEIIPFNRTYPDPSFIITEETIMRSLKGRSDVRERTVQGMRVEKKTAEKDMGMAEKFRP